MKTQKIKNNKVILTEAPIVAKFNYNYDCKSRFIAQ